MIRRSRVRCRLRQVDHRVILSPSAVSSRQPSAGAVSYWPLALVTRYSVLRSTQSFPSLLLPTPQVRFHQLAHHVFDREVHLLDPASFGGRNDQGFVHQVTERSAVPTSSATMATPRFRAARAAREEIGALSAGAVENEEISGPAEESLTCRAKTSSKPMSLEAAVRSELSVVRAIAARPGRVSAGAGPRTRRRYAGRPPRSHRCQRRTACRLAAESRCTGGQCARFAARGRRTRSARAPSARRDCAARSALTKIRARTGCGVVRARKP